MSSWKCNNCGLVNFATVEVCRRCQSPAMNGAVSNHPSPSNFQPHNAPPQKDSWQNNFAQQPDYRTGNLPAQFPQASSNDYSPNQSYQPNDYAQDNGYPQNSDASQNSGYADNHPYSQPPGYQQSSGYAYNKGGTDGLNYPSQPYTNYSQTDYSQAPSYGAPSMGGYQSSYSAGYGAQGAGVWRDGDKLVMHKQAMLPDRCVKCNAPTNREYLHRKLSWLHPAWLLLILASWIIYLIVYLAIRKKAEVDLGLCEQHKTSRRTAITVGWVTALLGLGCFILAIASETPGFIFLGILLFLFGVIFGSYAANVVSVTKMDDNYIWIKRVNKDYLSSFPPSGGF
jgi:hypothetical protein